MGRVPLKEPEKQPFKQSEPAETSFSGFAASRRVESPAQLPSCTLSSRRCHKTEQEIQQSLSGGKKSGLPPGRPLWPNPSGPLLTKSQRSVLPQGALPLQKHTFEHAPYGSRQTAREGRAANEDLLGKLHFVRESAAPSPGEIGAHQRRIWRAPKLVPSGRRCSANRIPTRN